MHENDLGHIFVAREGIIKQKGVSNQHYVIYTDKDKALNKETKEPEVIIMKKNGSDIMTNAIANYGVEVVNREGELTIKKTLPEKSTEKRNINE